MRIISTIQRIDDRTPMISRQIFDVEVSPYYDLQSGLVEERLFLDEGISGQGRIFHTNGLVLVDQLISSQTPLLYTFTFDTDVVILEFYLDGSRRIWVPGSERYVVPAMIADKSHNLRYIHKGHYHSILKADQDSDAFLLFLSKEFYFSLINQQSDLHKDFAEAVSAQRTSFLSSDYLKMSQDMRTLIGNVRNCTRKGSLHRLCLEIKISELLMLQYEQYHALQEKEQPKEQLSSSDQERLHLAKDILDELYHTPPTIKQLALQIGINEFKLKSGFKNIFQTTIHAYVVRKRMQRAYQLMQENPDVLVREVALEVGYQNPSHFSAAFKGYFGYKPKELV